ncbi:hypothetical protein L596_028535 [Steinernema carpocapsae]|uniref:Uncharacterized protein n=1 Tax=Steinernema carpocapsae TaxID=34508 RepID=A0A4U5LYS7_STECR|nr:hypothetical protein L596_028535 [Steinernema carpocapsae]
MASDLPDRVPLSRFLFVTSINPKVFEILGFLLSCLAMFGLVFLIVLEVRRTFKRIKTRKTTLRAALPMVELSDANSVSEQTRFNETMHQTYYWRDIYGEKMAAAVDHVANNVTRRADQEGM